METLLDELERALRAAFSSRTETQLETELASLDETDELGRILFHALPRGTVVALHGTLGAGKTRLVQAVAAESGIHAHDVTSPTFVLIQSYAYGLRPIHHFDVYRLKDDDEFLALGPEEYFDSNGLTFIEWAEKVESCLPTERVEITLTPVGETSRMVQIQLFFTEPS